MTRRYVLALGQGNSVKLLCRMTSVRLVFLTLPLVPFTVPAATTAVPPPTIAADEAASSDLTSLRAKAEKGNSIAQYNLGLAHLQGRQTPINLIEAFAWLTLAAEGGSTGRALTMVLDALTPEQRAAAQRRLDALRAAHPELRSAAVAGANQPAVAPPVTAKSAAVPIIGEPAPVRPAPPSTPIIAVPSETSPTTRDTQRLQDRLAALDQEKNQLAAELLATRKERDQLKSQLGSRAGTTNELNAVQDQFRLAQAALAKQSAELATLRTEAEAARAAYSKLQADFKEARDTLAARKAAAGETDEVAATLERERAAHAATQSTLAEVKRQLGDLTAAHTALEQDASVRTSAAERAQAASAEETRKLSAKSAELAQKVDDLARELGIARNDVASLRKKLATSEEQQAMTRKELAEARTALAAADRRAHAATSRLDAATQAESQLAALRTQVGTLERDLQTAQTETNRIISEKASVEVELADANRKLGESARALSKLRQQVAAESEQTAASAGQKAAALQSELDETKSRLVAMVTTAATRDAEIAKLRSLVTAAESRPVISAEDLEAARRAARDAKDQLAEANRELGTLRQQTTTARELENRVRELESENAALAIRAGAGDRGNESGDSGPGRANTTDLENKLSTALRSYSLVARERDELQARVAKLSARFSSTTEALSTAEAEARAATESVAVSVAATAEMETLRNRAAAAEREAETARAELARANQMLAALRPTAAPSRPVAPAGEPARTHTIAPGETLSSIALRYYGNASRWTDILSANRDVLVDERSFAVGRTLRIP